MTRNQIDKLGERLRSGSPQDADLRLLDEYRSSFSIAYENVIAVIRQKLTVQPVGRMKSNESILQKLRREPNMRLSRMQDIAGCRVVLEDTGAQDAAVTQLAREFERSRTVDRRQAPSHGYRAVHVIATVQDRVIEVQIRTSLQHRWAQLSERLADIKGPEVKYGEGPEPARTQLLLASLAMWQIEIIEQAITQRQSDQQLDAFLPAAREQLRKAEQMLNDVLQAIIDNAQRETS